MGYLRVLRGLVQAKSYIAPAALVKGIAVQEKSGHPDQIEAGGNNSVGFLLQNVLTNGIPFEIQNAGIPVDDVPINHAVTVRSGEGEIVSDQVLTSGTGNLPGATINASLGLNNGLWRVAQPGDVIWGKLREKDYGGTTGLYRIETFKTAVTV